MKLFKEFMEWTKSLNVVELAIIQVCFFYIVVGFLSALWGISHLLFVTVIIVIVLTIINEFRRS